MRFWGLPLSSFVKCGFIFLFLFIIIQPLFSQFQKQQAPPSRKVVKLPIVKPVPSNQDTLRFDGSQPFKTTHGSQRAVSVYHQQFKADAVQKTYTTNSTGSAITLKVQIKNTTCESNNGSVIVSPSGGTPPYQFSTDGAAYQSNGGFLFLREGTFPISVIDVSGDTATTEVTVSNTLPAPQGKVTSFIYPSNCFTADGSVTIEPTAGTPPFTYSLDLQTFQTSPTFSNLPQNWYTYYIKDANGCEGFTGFGAMYNRLCSSYFGFGVANTECGKNGAIYLTGFPYGGNRPYTFSLDGVHYGPDSTFKNLPTGIAQVYIKDASGNVVVYGFQIIDGCSIDVTATTIDGICRGKKGSLIASAQNGTPPYQYSIDGTHFQNSNQFDNLDPGIYTVIVKDTKDGLGLTSGFVIYGACLTLTAQSTNASCNKNNGAIIMHPAGGKPPYQYSINGTTFQTDSLFTSIHSGTYTTIVEDANQILDSFRVTVNETSSPSIQQVETTPTSCSGTDGIISVTAIGGITPLSYSLDGTSYQSSNVIPNLSGDKNYNVWVKDAQGCVVDSNSVFVKLNCLRASASSTSTNCGQKTGSITVTIEHGTAPYQYSIDGNHFQDQSIFLNLAKGSYTVMVKDAAGLAISLPVTVSEICLILQTNISNTTCGNNNGNITITASNGTAPYHYSIDGIHFQNSNTFVNLAANQYSITVKDATGNVQNTTAIISSTPSPTIEATATAVSCSNNDGTITVVASSGTTPYQFSVDDNNYQTSTTFDNLSTGDYKVEVKDANSCLSSQMITLTVKNTLQVHATGDTTICEGSNMKLGAVSTATSFQWMPSEGLNNAGLQNPIASPQITTTYFVTASTSVCTATDSATINVHPAPIPVAGADISVCYGKSVQLSGSGGTVYRWRPANYLSNTSIVNPIAICPPGTFTYSLTVQDGNGCTSLQNADIVVHVTPPAKLFAGTDTAIVMNQPFQLNAVDVNNSGFVSYQWTPVDGLTNPNIANPIVVINKDTRYSVTATTADSCAGTADVELKVYAGPDIYVPSAFSPNGNGRNDVIKAFPIGIASFRFFVIYDRWGKQVFYTSQPLQGWDGKTNSVLQTSGTYVWMACGVTSNNRVIERKGTLTLIR